MAALSTYFIPKVLYDINLFKVSSPTELNSKLIALQRAAVAAIGAYLYTRYCPPRLNQMTDTSAFVLSCTNVTGFCLATPSYLLELGAMVSYEGMVNITAGAKDKGITYVALGILEMVAGCYICNKYKEPLRAFFIPNTIDNLFIKISNRYSQRAWKYFYEN